jgi:hypothetical protein
MRMLVVIAAIAVFSPRPADACKGCKPPSEAELVRVAERVFAGKVVAVGESRITLEVDAIWKGAAPARESFPTTCWFARKVGAHVVILDRAGKPSKWISECLQLARDTPAMRARLDRLAGAPRAP